MNWKTLKNKYPEIWNDVYDGMIIDLLDCMDGPDITEYQKDNKKGRIQRIAHNAAFLACYAVHRLKK
jgi:hypothetical protein